jgi:hypothetical protein
MQTRHLQDVFIRLSGFCPYANQHERYPNTSALSYIGLRIFRYPAAFRDCILDVSITERRLPDEK